MNYDTADRAADRPLPAPLPYSSQAGRGEIPAPSLDPYVEVPDDPDAPFLREDEVTFWITAAVVGFFIGLMVLISWMGGL